MVSKQTVVIILLLFAILVSADCILVYTENNEYRFLTKPLLMPVLLALLFYQTKKTRHPISKLIIFSAVFFSWLGDIFLMKENSDAFFITGLSCFLAAHICYIIFFIRLMPFKQRSALLIFVSGLIIMIYMGTLLFILRRKLGDMRWPVVIYSGVISLMLLAAVNTFVSKKIGKISYRFLIPGAIFFVISDSLLALNKFGVHETNVDILVMLTYVIAQLLIVYGAVKFIKNKSRAKAPGIEKY